MKNRALRLPLLLALASAAVAQVVPVGNPRESEPVVIPVPLPEEPIPEVLPVRPPSPNLEGLMSAFTATTPEPGSPVAQASQTLTDRQISVTIVGHWGAVQTRDKSWIVQVPPTGCQITQISSSGGPWFAALNVPGDEGTDIHSVSFPLPRAVVPGDALVALSGSAGGNPMPPIRFAPTSSAIDEAMAIVFVPYAVTTGMLRPPALGRRTNPIVNFFRTFGPIPESLVQMDKLPSVIDIATLPVNWTAWGSYVPTFQNTLDLWGNGRFCGDLYDGWRAADRVPWTQHQGYGTYYVGAMSTSVLMLCSTAPAAAKAPLAFAMVQNGLDQVGAFADGRFLYPLGGHCWGRKTPIVLAGHLMGIEPFLNISNYVGEQFPEDSFFATTWWFGSATWTAGWQFSAGEFNNFPNAPSTWGNPLSPTHSTFGWAVTYMGQVVPAQIGTALAAELMGYGDSLNPALIQMVDQFVRGPPPAAIQQLLTAGIAPLPWGTDYAVPTGFALQSWKKYFTP